MITNSHKEIELCVTEDGNRRHSKDKYCKRRERWREMERERERERESTHVHRRILCSRGKSNLFHGNPGRGTPDMADLVLVRYC